MVIFRTPDGMPGYQQADGPADVVATVERLRNEDGVENIRVYRMDEVEFEYKVRYTVELKEPSPVGTTPEVEPTTEPAGRVAAEPATTSTEALSWDDDEDDTADEGAGGSGPFDQMAAIDTAAAPPWGTADEGAGDGDGEAGSRRGLFGR